MLLVTMTAIVAFVVVGCSGAPAVTPQIVYVTPDPVVPPTAVVTLQPTLTATPDPSPSPTATTRSTTAVKTVPAARNVTGTVTFLGDVEGVVSYTMADGCAGVGEFAGIRDGAELVFMDTAGSRLGSATLRDNDLLSEHGASCRYSFAVPALPYAPSYTVVLANLAEWKLPIPAETIDLSVLASDVKSATPAPSVVVATPIDEIDEEVAYYQEFLEDDVRDAIGIHIKGVEEIKVTRERIFIWVEANYSTSNVLKELQYELYDDTAGGVSDEWEPDIVIRMGSAYSGAWLQSTTDAGHWYDIDDQLEWERLTTFERKGAL